MFCPNCGANIPGGLDVCPECGTEISVTQNHGEGEFVPFIVAGDARDVQTPFGRVREMPKGGSDMHRSAIIEADEDELPEEGADSVMTSSGADTAGGILPNGDSMSDEWERGLHKENNLESAPSADDTVSGTESGQILSSVVSSPGDTLPPGQSSGPTATETPNNAENKSRSSASYPCNEPPSPSRRRPMILGLAVMIFVVLCLAILTYGLPGQGSGDAGVSIQTPLPTILSYATTVPTTELVPTFTPSENLILSVSAYGGGYKVEIDGGPMSNEVATILMTVEDTGGLHTMEWVYPSRHESFIMAREAYNGTASAIEHVTATATFTDGKKEVVFSGDL